MEKNASSKLIISKSPIAEFSKDLNYLIRYPYGCLEQTVSAAFPQLYIRDLALSLEQNSAANNTDIDYNVQQAINKYRQCNVMMDPMPIGQMAIIRMFGPACMQRTFYWKQKTRLCGCSG
jgi:hypothetical protein